MTSGLPTVNSNPSRRIVSRSTPRCNKPRPETWNSSAPSPGETRSATLARSSFSSLSAICRLVTNFPSRPTRGPSLMRKIMWSVGSSTFTRGIGKGLSGKHTVSPISISVMPSIAHKSPASIDSAAMRASPSNLFTPWMRAFRNDPSALQTTTAMFAFSTPSKTRPIPSRPT